MAERLRRQVKVSLAQIPGHESGVGSSPTLIIILFAFAKDVTFFWTQAKI
jgi:hypothetical protein